ncbi:MAG TPA: UDP-N-acetylmuramate--L-alanine ligase [Spirochaetes bacterium]|nr:UDP-N-acetylmuramate--L-alanine ligase [Spirochaetota bacterium]
MKSVHFVGVSGIGVSGAAKLAVESGLIVSGSADMENEQTSVLEHSGMIFYLGHKAEQLNKPDMVVKSAAVPENNPEILEARRKNIPVFLYSEYLGMLMSKKRGIAVSGTHGKTTTTAMAAAILANAGLDPTVVCGGVMQNFSSNAVYGRGDYFLSEACEYNRSFLDLKKWFGIVTNIEPDHLDYYRDIDDIKSAFSKFLKNTDPRGFSVVNGDDRNIQDVLSTVKSSGVVTVGFTNDSRYRVINTSSDHGVYSFQIEDKGAKVLDIRLSVPGEYNCINAALSAVMALNIGVQKSVVETGVASYKGTARRMEHIGVVGGNHIYSDYAHHPTEISIAIKALKEMHPEKNICLIFQPHQYSRTQELFKDFALVLGEPEQVILTEIFRQRDSNRSVNAVRGTDLYREVKKSGKNNITYIHDPERINVAICGSVKKNSIIVFMGAGDIDDTARDYVRQYGGN